MRYVTRAGNFNRQNTDTGLMKISQDSNIVWLCLQVEILNKKSVHFKYLANQLPNIVDECQSLLNNNGI